MCTGNLHTHKMNMCSHAHAQAHVHAWGQASLQSRTASRKARLPAFAGLANRHRAASRPSVESADRTPSAPALAIQTPASPAYRRRRTLRAGFALEKRPKTATGAWQNRAWAVRPERQRARPWRAAGPPASGRRSAMCMYRCIRKHMCMYRAPRRLAVHLILPASTDAVRQTHIFARAITRLL